MPNEVNEQATALAQLKRQMNDVAALGRLVSIEELEDAITQIATFLKTSSDTGGGRRLQQFVWSLWNTDHLMNLYDLTSYPVAPLTEAVITVFRAAMVGVLTEDQKRRLLTESGELGRWERICSQTPEDEEVLYPLPPASAKYLITLGASIQRSKKRAEGKRRSGIAEAGE
jgi:hypothetical protein